MGPLDEIARLKAARRAEIAAAEEQRRLAEEERRREFLALLESGIADVLERLGLAYLATYRAPAEPTVWDCDRRASVRFEIPGHRPIELNLRYRVAGAHLAAGWRPATHSYDHCGPWSVGDRSSHEDFTDALLDAEIEGWVPPPEEKPQLLRETNAKAAEAWPLVFDHAMPVPFAVDYVRDSGCEREQAVEAMLIRAAAWLNDRQPGFSDNVANPAFRAAMIAGHLTAQRFDEAEKLRGELAAELCEQELYGEAEDVEFAQAWIQWCQDAERAIKLCRELEAQQ